MIIYEKRKLSYSLQFPADSAGADAGEKENCCSYPAQQRYAVWTFTKQAIHSPENECL